MKLRNILLALGVWIFAQLMISWSGALESRVSRLLDTVYNVVMKGDTTNVASLKTQGLYISENKDSTTISFIFKPKAVLTIHDSASTITIGVQNQWYNITNGTPPSGNLFTQYDIDNFTMVGDTVVFNQSGHYEVAGNITLTGSGNQTYGVFMVDYFMPLHKIHLD